MPTTFANTIDGNEILAKRSQCDYAGNDIQTTYATKSELPTATSDLMNDSDFITSSDIPVKDVQVGGTSVVNAQGIAEISIPQTGVLDVEVDGSSVVNAQGVAEITLPTFTQVNADWEATSGVAQILNKPAIPTATSDLTNDSGFITLSDVPAQVNADWNSSSGVSEILNKPTIPSYTAGNGIDITSNVISAKVDGTTIDTNASGELTVIGGGGGGGSQVNSDWDATSGVAEILNKPTPKTLTAGANISISEGVGTLTISAAAGLPASTSADEGKCLVVDSNGDPEWGTGGKTYTGTDGVVVDNVNDTVGLEAPVDLVGGPGITVDNPDGNTVRVSANMDSAYLNQLAVALGIDETVLFNTNDYNGSATLNLSEPFTNFERLKVLAVRANNDQSAPYSFSGPWCEFETAGITINSGKAFGSLTPWIFENKFWKIAVYGATSTTQFTWSSGLQKDMTSTSAGSMDSSQHSVQIKTVIGIHRIAND